MSRTFRKGENGRRPEDTRRNKRREKSNSHWMLPESESYNRRESKRNKNYKNFELDTDLD